MVCRWLPVVASVEAMLPVDAAKYTGGDPEMALSMADAGGSSWLWGQCNGRSWGFMGFCYPEWWFNHVNRLTYKKRDLYGSYPRTTSTSCFLILLSTASICAMGSIPILWPLMAVRVFKGGLPHRSNLRICWKETNKRPSQKCTLKPIQWTCYQRLTVSNCHDIPMMPPHQLWSIWLLVSPKVTPDNSRGPESRLHLDRWNPSRNKIQLDPKTIDT